MYNSQYLYKLHVCYFMIIVYHNERGSYIYKKEFR